MKPLALLFLAIAPGWLSAQPLYPNSVASNDLDFILVDDPGACWSIAEVGNGRTEMYDPRRGSLFVEGARRFAVLFSGQQIHINVHPDVADPRQRATQTASALSRLPDLMRKTLKYVNILDGDGTAWEEGPGGFFTLYDGLMERRLAEHDLDETVFHETAHVALDALVANDPDWPATQISDGDFITGYAAENPDKEDIPESALFVWTILHHPGRLPADVETAVRDIMPNRLEYLGNMLEGYLPPTCDS